MSIRDALADLAAAAVDEFSEDIEYIPTIRPPNGRPIADPNRPAYLLRGIYDKNVRGSQRLEAELAVHHKGRHQTTVLIVHPVITVPRSALRYPVAQGDEVVIVADAERFRVLNAERAMRDMVRIMLEQLGGLDFG